MDVKEGVYQPIALKCNVLHHTRCVALHTLLSLITPPSLTSINGYTTFFFTKNKSQSTGGVSHCAKAQS